MAIGTTAALAVTLATTAISAGVNAYSQRQAGKARDAAHKYNAKVQENAAIQEGYNAAEQTRRQRKRHKRILARQRAMLAKSGVMETGTPLDVMAETAGNMELEIADRRWQSDIKQSDFRAKAGMELWEGDQARRAGNLAAGASLLGGTTSVARQYVGRN